MPTFRSIVCITLLALHGAAAQAQNWLETNIRIGELTDIGELAEATELSEHLIEQATAEFGENSEQLAESHLISAEINFAREFLIGAEDDLVTAIRIYEQMGGSLSTQLIGPYTDLGDIYVAMNEYQLALGAYNEARGIGRRNLGLESLIQLPLLYKISSVVERLGDRESATNYQLDALDLLVRNYGTASEQYLLGLYGLAEWLGDRGYYIQAGNLYRRATNVLTRQLGRFDMETIYAARNAARSLRLGARDFEYCNREDSDRCVVYESVPAPYGDFADNNRMAPRDLSLALSIAHEMEGTTELQAEIWRDVGDWYVAHDERFSIAAPYLRSVELLQELENGDELMDEWFGRAVQVYVAPFSARELSELRGSPQGSVTARFLVEANGITDDIEVVTSDPEGLLDRDVVRHIKNSRFRPMVEDGQVVPATRTFTVEFRYDPRFAE